MSSLSFCRGWNLDPTGVPLQTSQTYCTNTTLSGAQIMCCVRGLRRRELSRSVTTPSTVERATETSTRLHEHSHYVRCTSTPSLSTEDTTGRTMAAHIQNISTQPRPRMSSICIFIEMQLLRSWVTSWQSEQSWFSTRVLTTSKHRYHFAANWPRFHATTRYIWYISSGATGFFTEWLRLFHG